jgi:hypothetical protein
VQPFVGLSQVRATGGTIVLDRLSSGRTIDVEVARIEQAVPLARDIVAKIAPQGRALPGFGRLEVAVAGARNAEEPPVVIRELAAPDRRVPIAVLDAATRLTDRQPEVSTNGRTGELRVRAEGVTDAGAAWRAAAGALAVELGDPEAVNVYVDEVVTDHDGDDRRPILSGGSGTSPDRALALLRALQAPGTYAFSTTDLTYAMAEGRAPGSARAAATAARDAGVRRVSVSWPVADTKTTSATNADGDRATTSLDDTPATVLQVLPGVARARAAGIAQVKWDRPSATDVPRLRLAQPRWFDVDAAPEDRPAQLRRLARAVRAVAWPGAAGFDLALGHGTCDEYPTAQAVGHVVSTSDGPARIVKAGASCTTKDSLAELRAAWDATAA